MKFTNINYADLIGNMKQYEIDIFEYAKRSVEAYENGKFTYATSIHTEACGYINALLYNNIITIEEYDLLSKYLFDNYIGREERE